jgi:hypothetical protein
MKQFPAAPESILAVKNTFDVTARSADDLRRLPDRLLGIPQIWEFLLILALSEQANK